MTDRRCVVVGDVVESRAVEDRERLRTRLEDGLDAANDAAADDLVAPFATLKGVDEVGGVLADPSGAYRAMREIAEAVHPVVIRFAVVWGAVDVGSTAGEVARMDGPAFHEADAVLEDVRRTDRHVGLSVPGTDDWLARLVADQVDLVLMWKAEWTTHQMETVREYRDCGTMAAVAERRGVSVQAVSQTLERAGAARITEIEEGLTAAMGELWGDLA